MRKAAVIFFGVVLAAACMAVGLKIKGEERYRSMVDIYADIILPIAEDAERYYDALDLTEAYVTGQTDVGSMLKGLEKGEEELRGIRNSLADSEEEAVRCLAKAGFDKKGAQKMAERRAVGLEEYIWSLESLQDYFQNLEEKDFTNSDKMCWSRTVDTIKGTSRGLRYYGDINYWFAGESEERMEYVLEKIVRRLPPPAAEPFGWEKDPVMVDQKLGICREYRECYYEIEYPVSAHEDLEKVRSGYERAAALKEKPVYPGTSWMNSLTEVRNLAETMAYWEDALKRRETYGDLYYDEMLENQ